MGLHSLSGSGDCACSGQSERRPSRLKFDLVGVAAAQPRTSERLRARTHFAESFLMTHLSIASGADSPHSSGQRLRRLCLTGAFFAATVTALAVQAEESTLAKDAKQAGHAIGNAAREVGHAAKKAGEEVGHDVAHAAKEAGPAAKEAGSDLGSRFAALGHRIGHAAKEGWESFLSLFHSKS
jgi:hypothetical protein